MKFKMIFLGVAAVIATSAFTWREMADNTLSKKEKKAGWKLLFNGSNEDGWRTYQSKSADSWSVKDGNFYCKGSNTDKTDKRADMITVDEYENFDLSVDWKLSPQGNSGILYMVTEEFPTAYFSGPEYQLIDDKNFPEKLEDWQKLAPTMQWMQLLTLLPIP